jgi:hypothetical protein
MACPWLQFFHKAGLSAAIWAALEGLLGAPLLALEVPATAEIPEEVLRTEIIIEARSPIDGQRLTAAEYAELQAELRSTDAIRPKVSPKIQRLILLLRVRKVLRSIAPFLVP